MELKDHHNRIYNCSKCRMCFYADWSQLEDFAYVCPPGVRFGYEAYFSAGRLEVVRGIEEGQVKSPSQRLLHVLYSCILCGACSAMCQEVSMVERPHVIFEEARGYMVEKLGWAPLEAHRNILESVRRNHNPYREEHKRRFNWLSEPTSEQPESLYFAGCTASYREREIASSTASILGELKVEWGVLGGEEWCCGSPLLRIGYRRQAEELAEHNVKAIQESGAERVIFSCSGCYKTFKEDYPKLLGNDLPFKPMHIVEFLEEQLREGKLKLKSGVATPTTYHDPCHLGREAQVYEAPRAILKTLCGERLVEMKRNRKNAWCCGAGGGVKSAMPDFALWTATERVKEARGAGAELLVSACPFCKRNLSDAVKASGVALEVKDITELVAESLR